MSLHGEAKMAVSLRRWTSWLLFTASLVVAEPLCTLDNRSIPFNYIRCSGFTSPSDFNAHVQRPLRQQQLVFTLRDSHLEYIPQGAFPSNDVLILELANVTVADTYGDGDVATRNPFVGLEDSLWKIHFSRDSTLPKSWTVFVGMRQLKVLTLSEMTRLNLDERFNQLPASLHTVEVINSSVAVLHPMWLSTLQNLKLVSVSQCNLTAFARSMLPLPGIQLENLGLPNNALTSLPEGLELDLPALKFLNLDYNRLTTLPEENFKPLLQKPNMHISLLGMKSGRIIVTRALRLHGLINLIALAADVYLIPEKPNRISIKACFLVLVTSASFCLFHRFLFFFTAGNRLNCDCRLRYLANFTTAKIQGWCHSPESLRGQYLSEVSLSDLECAATTTPVSS